MRNIPAAIPIACVLSTMFGGCSEPSAVYHTLEGDPVALFQSPDFPFRFGRSLVLVSADDTGVAPAPVPKPAAATSAPKALAGRNSRAAPAEESSAECPTWKFTKAVIDPTLAPTDGSSWSEWEPLPGWEPIAKNNAPAYSYRIRLVPDTAVTIDEQAFRDMQGKGLRVFPVSSCAALDLEIGTTKQCVAPILQSWRLKVAAVPSEFAPPDPNAPAQTLAPVWRMRGEDNFFSVSKLKVSYVPDTLLVKQLGVKVDDKTGEIIQGVGGVLLAVAPFVVGGDAKTHAVQRFSIKVADSRRLRSIPLPTDGTIDLPDACTANVTDTSTAGSGDAVGSVKTAVDQAKAIYTTWADAKKKAEDAKKQANRFQ